MNPSGRSARDVIQFPARGGRESGGSGGRGSTPIETRMLPESIEAEQAVLGAILVSSAALGCALAVLKSEDFYRTGHKLIFSTVAEMTHKGEAIDFVTVAENLRRRGMLDDLGGAEYLTAMTDGCPNHEVIDSYCALVLDASHKRFLAGLGERINNLAYGENTSVEIRAAAAQGLEQLAARTPQREADQGWTAAELMTMEFQPTPCAVEGLIPIGLSIFAGKPKIGKSWMTYALSLAVATGTKFLGKHLTLPGEALYLALEDTPIRLKGRLEKLLCGEAAPGTLRLFRDWERLDAGGMERLDKYLADNPGCRLVVIDTFEKVRPKRAGGNVYEEDYLHLGALKRLADNRNVSIVVVMHVSKRETSDVLESIVGSEGQNGAADATLVLQRSRDAKEGTLFVTGRDIEERKIPLRWASGLGTWSEVDEDEARELALSQEQTEIMELLRGAGYPMEPREIAEALGKRSNAIYALLHRMKARGAIIAEGKKYSCSPNSVDCTDTESYSLTHLTHLTPENTQKNLDFESKMSKDSKIPDAWPPPEPAWLDKEATACNVGRHVASNFWAEYHEKYTSECSYEWFQKSFPLWLNDAFP